MKENIKKYSLFLFSLIIMGLGIVCVTKSSLGTSSISSIPYVLSLIFNMSFGMFSFIVNVMFFLVQLLIMNGKLAKQQYLQLLVAPVLGVFIDVWMSIFVFLNPVNYISQMVLIVLGSLIMAISIRLQLRAGVVTAAGEGMVKVISYKSNIEFGKIKVYVDLLLVFIATVMSFVFLGELKGIREGTLVTAILVGVFIRVIGKIKLRVLDRVETY